MKYPQTLKKYKNQIFSVLRPALGIGLAAALVHTTLKMTGADLAGAVDIARTPGLIFCIFIHGLVIVLTSFRWKLLLRVQGVDLSVLQAVKFVLMSFFFSLALPGAVSGDVIKMGFVAARTENRKTEAMMTVMLDRVFGVTGLFAVAGIAVLICMPQLLGLSDEYGFVRISAFLVGIGSFISILLLALLVFHTFFMRFPPLNRAAGFLSKIVPKSVRTTIERLSKSLILYRKENKTVFGAFALSVLVHSLLAFNLFCIGRIAGETILGLKEYFLAAQISNAVAAIPITPGGIGARDATTAMFLTAMHAPAAKTGAIALIMTFILLLWGMTGGVIFTFSGSRHHNLRDFSTETDLTDNISRE